jgi:2-polyprenyl-3-methyl-5-hydroxy-6-metoxy-1,4-benzoquinol methylase
MTAKCNCCLAKRISNNTMDKKGYLSCQNCGLVFSEKSKKLFRRKNLVVHYSTIDPHKNVALAKRKIFNYALDYLEKDKSHLGKRMLDIGCGFGYFIEMASKRGWEAYGVEISDKAVQVAKSKIGVSNIFNGTVKEKKYDNEFFSVITLWDVIVEMDDPFDEIEECYRILDTKGKIGIRVRNLFFQKMSYGFYQMLKKIKLHSKIKKPYVFHKYCFSSKSIYFLLTRIGFKNICITNSYITEGDPYQYVKYCKIIQIVKIFCKIISDLIYWTSFGKCIVGPSLMIWAEKSSK